MTQPTTLDPDRVPETRDVTSFADACDFVGVMADDREAWLLARHATYGGSEAAAIMGLNPYVEPVEIYANHVAEATGEEQSASEAAHWGNILERPILEEYARRSGDELLYGGALLRSKEHPLLACTLDAELKRGDTIGAAQVKTTVLEEDWKTHDQGFAEWTVPVYVQIQIQHELLVTGAPFNEAILLPLRSRQMRTFPNGPHHDFQALLLERIVEMDRRVQERRPPDVQGTESSRRALKKLFPEDTQEGIKLIGEDWLAKRDELERLADLRKQVVQREEQLKAEFKLEIADNTFGDLDDGRFFSLKTSTKKVYECSECSHLHRSEPFRTLRPCKAPNSKSKR